MLAYRTIIQICNLAAAIFIFKVELGNALGLWIPPSTTPWEHYGWRRGLTTKARPGLYGRSTRPRHRFIKLSNTIVRKHKKVQNTAKHVHDDIKHVSKKKRSKKKFKRPLKKMTSIKPMLRQGTQLKKVTQLNHMPTQDKQLKNVTQLNQGQDKEGEPTKPNEIEEDAYFEPPDRLGPYNLRKVIHWLLRKYKKDPDLNITVETVGRTAEYNELILVKMLQKPNCKAPLRGDKDDKYAPEREEKMIMFIAHGLSVMGMTTVPALSSPGQLEHLFSMYMGQIEKFDIFWMPMANPDGFAQLSQTSSWNKNTSPQKACPGVSVDRNFDVAWNKTKSNLMSTCSQHYPGIMPFSEAESIVIQEILQKYGHKMACYIHVHAGTYSPKFFKGDAVLFPSGFTEEDIADDQYIDLRGDIDMAMKEANFHIISVGVTSLSSWYGGKVEGTSIDYAATVFGVPFALEFVMQPYEDSSAFYSDIALKEIWARVIVAVFTNVWESIGGDTSLSELD